LKEIGAGVRASNDFQELGDYNPTSVLSLLTIPIQNLSMYLKANGILLASVAPKAVSSAVHPLLCS
jgi:hypothetical protein